MHTLKTTTLVSAALISLLLSACGGSGSPMNNNTGGGTGGGDVDTTTPQKIGSGSGGEFKEGNIGVTNDVTDLSAGGTTTLTVYVVSSTNTPVTASTNVSFISSCIAANKAVLKDSAGKAVNTVATVNGRATITYTANGCVGKDEVTASASLSSVTKYANVNLNIQAGTVGSIQFSSAEPAQISLKGSGGIETATLRFRVLDGNGAPIERTSVTFSMSTTAGGLSLFPTTALSDGEGYVETKINAGTVPTDVSVIATVDGSGISTSSLNLAVSTGVPVQRSVSLSATKFNPRAWDRDGEEVTMTMRMADDFGNPVVNDTAVTFWAEGGSIDPNCKTKNGSCSVVWRSQSERPINGRVTILAFASGNESFTDANTNGQYDAGETFLDMAEAYRDDDESNTYNAGTELYVNLANGTANRDPGDGVYSGTLCKSTDTAVCSKEKVTVRKSWTLAMSSPHGVFGLYSDPECLTSIPMGSITGSSGTVYVLVSDINGNSLPSETKITIDPAKALDMIVSKMDTVVPNTPDAVCYGIGVSGPIGVTGSFLVQSETKEKEISSAVFSVKFN
ncbi:MAG TPA: hypothetical protein VLC79_17030 [Cellvibrio sp.]|nr:hypothetical protein [Cellvibrio sp.]